MVTRRELIWQAERAFDENNFSSASEKYREAAMMAPEDLDLVLGNLIQAEQYKLLLFIRALQEKFPDSLELRFHEAWFFDHHLRSSFAVRIFSQLLEQDLPARDELSAHNGRLRATAKTKDPSHFVEDFMFLWERMPRGKQRHYLLRICSGVEAFEFIPVMDELARSELFSPEIRAFFDAKANELKRLQNSSQHLRETETL